MTQARPEQLGPPGAARPPDPSRPFTVLFVCTANICRSPLAQELLLLALGNGRAADRFRVSSAGTHGYGNLPMDPGAATELCRLGGDPQGFRSRALTDTACLDADLILTATREHRSVVLDRVPRALRRTLTMLEFAWIVGQPESGATCLTTLVAGAAATRGTARPENYDVSDPYGGSADDHRRTADAIHAAVTVIGARLTSSV